MSDDASDFNMKDDIYCVNLWDKDSLLLQSYAYITIFHTIFVSFLLINFVFWKQFVSLKAK